MSDTTETRQVCVYPHNSIASDPAPRIHATGTRWLTHAHGDWGLALVIRDAAGERVAEYAPGQWTAVGYVEAAA